MAELVPPLELTVLEQAIQALVPTARAAIQAIAQGGGCPPSPATQEPRVKALAPVRKK